MTEEYLINWFVEYGNLKKEQIKTNDNYIENGYIDSFGFLDLISNCEDYFKVRFSDKDFENEDIFTISGIVRCIEGKK